MLILEFCDKENQNDGLLETKKKKRNIMEISLSAKVEIENLERKTFLRECFNTYVSNLSHDRAGLNED